MNTNYSITKWPGGKNRELSTIIEYIPKNIIQFERFIEPFVGGGSVFAYFSDNFYFDTFLVNDLSNDLILLYKCVEEKNKKFFNFLKIIFEIWTGIEKMADTQIIKKIFLKKFRDFEKNKITDLEFKDFIMNEFFEDSKNINNLLSDKFNKDIVEHLASFQEIVYKKFLRIKKISLEMNESFSNSDINDSIHASYKAAIYYNFRDLYNKKIFYKLPNEQIAALFFFLREFCYGSMFRFNSKGEFNIPYGGIGYNNKNFNLKLKKLSWLGELYNENNVSFYNQNYDIFLSTINLTQNDFIFLDPPYDTSFSEYDKNSFTKDDHIKLHNFLLNTKSKFLMIINNSDFINQLYSEKKFKKIYYEKKYSVNIKNRNQQSIEHILIKNY